LRAARLRMRIYDAICTHTHMQKKKLYTFKFSGSREGKH
jgi:hypothetical protein